MVNDDIFIVGVNGSNKARCRKIIWAGKLSQVMSFSEASSRFSEARYDRLRKHQQSPLHVRPLMWDGKLVGYKHVSTEHMQDDEWVADLVSNSGRRNVRMEGRNLILQHGTAWQAFDRDCCMLLENRFFALDQGIPFDEACLRILKNAQPEKRGVDRYAVFGLATSEQADGRRGSFLALSGDLASRFVAWLEDKCAKYAQEDGIGPANAARSVNSSARRRRTISCTPKRRMRGWASSTPCG
jgi:hypothetical protein